MDNEYIIIGNIENGVGSYATGNTKASGKMVKCTPKKVVRAFKIPKEIPEKNRPLAKDAKRGIPRGCHYLRQI